MVIRKTGLLASLALAVAVGCALSSPAAADQQLKNTVGGAAIGAGVGYLVGGQNGAAGGAVVGAIAGYTKNTGSGKSNNGNKKNKK